MMKNYLSGLLFAALSMFGLAANAVIDVTAATTGISDAGVAILAVLAALLALSVSVYGVKKVYDFMSRKSGV